MLTEIIVKIKAVIRARTKALTMSFHVSHLKVALQSSDGVEAGHEAASVEVSQINDGAGAEANSDAMQMRASAREYRDKNRYGFEPRFWKKS